MHGIPIVVRWNNYVRETLNLDHSVYYQLLYLQLRIQRPGKGGTEKHEIYVAAFGGHLFYDLFLQSRGGGGAMAPLPPGSATDVLHL